MSITAVYQYLGRMSQLVLLEMIEIQARLLPKGQHIVQGMFRGHAQDEVLKSEVSKSEPELNGM